MSLVRSCARLVPVGVPIGGRKPSTLLPILDPLFRTSASDDVIRTPWGALALDSSHEQERLLSYLYFNMLRYYDRSELGRYIARVAEPGWTFLDIGSNLGMYALVARRYGFDTVVVEPEPRHSAFLQRNEHVFGKVLPIALSNRSGSLPLYYEPTNAGGTSLFPDPSYVLSENVVPVYTFSQIVASGDLEDVSRIRLVKIDVEGFEAEVVEGMCEVLETGWRPDIWCEVRGDRSGRNGGSYRKVRQILGDFGYVARELKNGRDQSLDERELGQRTVFDLLFTAGAK
jgi:FkbM family methyltransferase